MSTSQRPHQLGGHVRGRLSALAVLVAATALGVQASPAARATTSTPSNLNGTGLYLNDAAIVNNSAGPTDPPGCNSSGWSTLTMTGKGSVTDGPYARGTFTMSGTATFGPQTDTSVGQGIYGFPAKTAPLTSWSQTYRIVSGDTTIDITTELHPNPWSFIPNHASCYGVQSDGVGGEAVFGYLNASTAALKGIQATTTYKAKITRGSSTWSTAGTTFTRLREIQLVMAGVDSTSASFTPQVSNFYYASSVTPTVSNTAPVVAVTGVTQGSYEMGAEPVPGCAVTDAEDFDESASPVVSSLSGDFSAYGVGTRTVTCSYTDVGGLTGTDAVTYEVVDTIAPKLVGTPTTTANSNGWYNGPVTIDWTVTDDGAGVDSASIPGPTLISVDGRGLTVSASVVDRAGNPASASSPGVNIDQTKPKVAFGGNAGRYTVDQQVTIGCNAIDTLSGIASQDCPTLSVPAWSLPLGINTLTATANDLAGNTTNTSATFRVYVTTSSLCELVKGFSTNSGVTRSLCQKLGNAQAASDRGNVRAKAGIMSSFVNEVTAQSGKLFTEAQVDVLNTLAGAL